MSSSGRPSALLAGLLAGLLAAATAQAQPAGGMTRISKVTLSDPLDRSLYSMAHDPAGFVYVAPSHGGRVTKVDVRGSVPVEVGTAICTNGETGLLSSAIDPAAGYVYFGMNGQPGKVVKFALGAAASAPAYIGSTTLLSGENAILGIVIDTTDPDPAKHYLYAATFTDPGTVVKLAPGAGNGLPVRLAATTFPAGLRKPRRAVIDPAAGYAYFASVDAAAFVAKVALGAGSAPPAFVAAASLNADEGHVGGLVIDPVNGYAYAGGYDQTVVPTKIVKIALGAGNAAPTRVGALTLGPGERLLSSGVIDAARGYAFFGSDLTHPAKIYKIRLGAGAALPTEAGVLPLQPGTCGTACYPADGGVIVSADATTYGELYIQSSGIDLARGIAYFGTDTVPGQVVAVGLYPPPAATNFYPVTPCRLVDTRDPAGPWGGPALAAAADRVFTLAGRCGVPASALSLVTNVTVTGTSAAGDLKVFPSDGVLPTAIAIAFGSGQTRANNAMLLLSGDGAGTVTVHNDTSGTVHLIVDVSGYFQ